MVALLTPIINSSFLPSVIECLPPFRHRVAVYSYSWYSGTFADLIQERILNITNQSRYLSIRHTFTRKQKAQHESFMPLRSAVSAKLPYSALEFDRLTRIGGLAQLVPKPSSWHSKAVPVMLPPPSRKNYPVSGHNVALFIFLLGPPNPQSLPKRGT